MDSGCNIIKCVSGVYYVRYVLERLKHSARASTMKEYFKKSINY